MKRKLCIALILVLMLLRIVPFEALAQEIVVNPIGSAEYKHSYQERSFYGAGRQWSFFIDASSYLCFRSSADNGSTWGTTTQVKIIKTPGDVWSGSWLSYQDAFSLYWDGTYVHTAAATDGYADRVEYQRGTPNSDGTITWTANQLNCIPGVRSGFPSVSVDTSGRPWLAVSSNGWVSRSSTTDGTWVTDTGFPYNVTLGVVGPTNEYGWLKIVALTDNKMVAMMVFINTDTHIFARRYDGANWGSFAKSTNSVVVAATPRYVSWDCVAQDDDVHCIYLETGSQDIQYVKYQYSTNSFISDTQIYAAATATSSPTMTMDNANNLHVFWENDPTDDHVYYAKYIYDESTWVSYYDLIDEIDDLPATGYYLNTDYTCDESRVGVYYIAGAAILKFKLLDEVLHVDTLTASPIGATTATLRGEIVSLGFGSATERGFWINDSPSLSGATQEGNETGTFNVGVFTHGITGLTEGLKYYYCAYASNAYGLEYGTWSQFTAGGSAGGIAVLTLDPTNVGDFEATFNGNIVATGGNYLTMRGFQWGFSDTPTWLWDEGGNFTVGLFAHTPTDLEADSIYYVRAMAGNGTDTDYGQWIGFITEQPSYVPGEDSVYTDLITAPIPTTAPGGWIRPGKDYNGFPIISPLINTFADLGFGRSFFWFIVEVFCIIVLTLIGARFTKNLPITFGILLVLFLLPFIAFEYLDWWMLLPFLVVGGALCIKEGQFSWT
jgi:hypothetical protein